MKLELSIDVDLYEQFCRESRRRGLDEESALAAAVADWVTWTRPEMHEDYAESTQRVEMIEELIQLLTQPESPATT